MDANNLTAVNEMQGHTGYSYAQCQFQPYETGSDDMNYILAGCGTMWTWKNM